MNQEMRSFSKKHGTPLVNTHDRFMELLADGGPRSNYFITETDDHPNAQGYSEIATLVADIFAPLGAIFQSD